jgi:uroporphyrin-3 C-methyltransferase
MNPPQELLAIKQNINLMLEQAQVALMMRQPMIYQESLQRARDWIDNYLSGLSETAPQLLAEVDSLLATRLSPVLPDISGSLREIRQIRGAGADAVAGNLR